MTDMPPKDMAARLRQVSASCADAAFVLPPWFKERTDRDGIRAWGTFLSEAADELEQMQQLAGRLLKRLAGD